MFSYYELTQVVGHLRDREAAALLSTPPHEGRTAALIQALHEAQIEVVYHAHEA